MQIQGGNREEMNALKNGESEKGGSAVNQESRAEESMIKKGGC